MKLTNLVLMALLCLASAFSKQVLAQERIVLEDYGFSFELPYGAEIEEQTSDMVIGGTNNIRFKIEAFNDGESYVEFTQRMTFDLKLKIYNSSYITYLKGFNAMMLEGEIDEETHIVVYLNDGKYNFLVDILWDFEEGNQEAFALVKSIE